jgi:two-component system, OmpR family, sensor histidine kinase MprB
MTLRARLTLLAAAAVAAAIALASVAAFLITRAELRDQVDTSLVRVANSFSRLPVLPLNRLSEQDRRLPTIAAQRILPSGSAQPVAGQTIPVDEVDRAVARGERGMVLRDRRVGAVHLRVITVPARGTAAGAWQFGRPLTEQDRTLAQLALILGLVAAAGVLGSAVLGLAVARAGLAPVDRLTERAEYVARTQDLGALIEVRGNDEIARLARSLNAMLTALDDSKRRQRRLVTDAGHELRTPLTSLRTNIELLVHSDRHPERALPASDRRALLADLSAQLRELTGLAADLIDAARDEAGDEVEDIQLAGLVAGTVERARLRAPAICFDLDLQPAAVHGRRQLLERAVTNILDNAAKWSPEDGTVQVRLRDGELTVRDHGPGVAAEDLPFVFDRFYRAPAARHLPGSGLGLAIVREAVESHGGTVSVTAAPGGGTLVRLRLPALPVTAAAR